MDLTLVLLKPTGNFNSTPTFLVIWYIFIITQRIEIKLQNINLLASETVLLYVKYVFLENALKYTF